MDDITKELAKLIEQISMLAPELWRIALQQVYADIAFYIMFSIFWTALLAGGIFATVKVFKVVNEKEDDYGLAAIVSTLPSIAVIGGFLGTMYCVSNSLMRIINPEWYAIQNIMSLLN